MGWGAGSFVLVLSKPETRDLKIFTHVIVGDVQNSEKSTKIVVYLYFDFNLVGPCVVLYFDLCGKEDSV